jgi:hypothetical protein
MTRDDIIRMAREVDGDFDGEIWLFFPDELERYATLVAAAEREKVAQWMMQRGYATGHGDTTEDLLQELDWQILEGWNRALMNGVKTEREACIRDCDSVDLIGADDCIAAIRARGAS